MFNHLDIHTKAKREEREYIEKKLQHYNKPILYIPLGASGIIDFSLNFPDDLEEEAA